MARRTRPDSARQEGLGASCRCGRYSAEEALTVAARLTDAPTRLWAETRYLYCAPGSRRVKGSPPEGERSARQLGAQVTPGNDGPALGRPRFTLGPDGGTDEGSVECVLGGPQLAGWPGDRPLGSLADLIVAASGDAPAIGICSTCKVSRGARDLVNTRQWLNMATRREVAAERGRVRGVRPGGRAAPRTWVSRKPPHSGVAERPERRTEPPVIGGSVSPR